MLTFSISLHKPCTIWAPLKYRGWFKQVAVLQSKYDISITERMLHQREQHYFPELVLSFYLSMLWCGPVSLFTLGFFSWKIEIKNSVSSGITRLIFAECLLSALKLYGPMMCCAGSTWLLLNHTLVRITVINSSESGERVTANTVTATLFPFRQTKPLDISAEQVIMA